jgi:hypothetical protein
LPGVKHRTPFALHRTAPLRGGQSPGGRQSPGGGLGLGLGGFAPNP